MPEILKRKEINMDIHKPFAIFTKEILNLFLRLYN